MPPRRFETRPSDPGSRRWSFLDEEKDKEKKSKPPEEAKEVKHKPNEKKPETPQGPKEKDTKQEKSPRSFRPKKSSKSEVKGLSVRRP